jgi:DNA repair protein SbcC/Rad50
MKLLASLFGKKKSAQITKENAPLPVAPVEKAPKPVITLDEVHQTSDENRLLQLASEGATAQLRQAAAEKIQSREPLEALAKLAKTKDKNVYKIVKTKLDLFKQADHALAEIESSAKRIAEKMEKHSHLEADALFKAKLLVLQDEWAAVADKASDSTQAVYTQGLAACNAKIQAKAQAIADEEERQQQDTQALELAEASLRDIKGFAANILQVGVWTDEQFTNIEHKIQELSHAMRIAMNRQLPIEYLQKQFEARKQQTLNLLDQIKTSGSVSQLLEKIKQGEEQLQPKFQTLIKMAKDFGDDASDAVAQAKQDFIQWRDAQSQQEQAVKETIREFNELLRKGLWSAEQGFVRKAKAIQKDLLTRKEKLTEVPRFLQTKLDEFEQQLEKWGDWHEFAVTPKKEALIQQMQALITADIAPADKAEKIHDLQDSWKEISKGGQQQDEQLWADFQQASQAAYAPCKEYFEKQAAERELHLQKRRDMVTQLQTYLSAYHWESAVWKDVEQTLKTARQEWQTYWPVPRKAGNDLQKEFENLMEQIFGKMSAAFEANKQQKHKMVEQAKQLLTMEDTRAACDKVKQLQLDWKNIGRTWFKEDQSLWNEFRQVCDAVFNKRQEQYSAAQAERQSLLDQAKQLVDAVNALLQSDDAAQIKTSADELQQQFAQLALPRDQAKALEQSMQKAQAAVKDRIRQIQSAREKNRWQAILDLAKELSVYELACIKGQADPQQLEAISSSLNSNSNWPKAIVTALQSRLNNAANLSAADVEAATRQLRQLVMRADILAGRESPEAERPARMAYQIQQMQQGLGKREIQFSDLQSEWFATPGLAADYDQLLARFMA